MGARTQGCTSMCTRWADRGASSLQPGKPSANGWLDISCHLFVHMVFAPCSGVTYLGFEVFDGGSYPRLHFLVHSSLPYIHTYLPCLFGGLFSGFGALQKWYWNVLFCAVLYCSGAGMVLEWSWNDPGMVLEWYCSGPGTVRECSWNGLGIVLEWS